MGQIALKIIPLTGAAVFFMLVQMTFSVGAHAKDQNLGKFTGIWKVKEYGGFILPRAEFRTWVIRQKGKKLIVEMPERGFQFDDVEVSGRKLSATIVTERSEHGEEDKTASFEIVLREDQFDGYMLDGPRYVITGRFYKLYSEARKAEENFLKKFEDEKRRLGEEVKRLDQYARDIAQQKTKIAELMAERTALSKKVAGSQQERNKDLGTLKRQYQSKFRSSSNEFNKQIKKLRAELAAERKKAPRVNVSRMPRNSQSYRSLDLKKAPDRRSRTYMKLGKGQALIKLANVNNGWSLVATDQGDMGYVPTSQLRSVTASFAPPPAPAAGSSGNNAPGENQASDGGIRLVNITQPRRGTGAKRNFLFIPAPGFVTFKGTVSGSSSSSLKINDQNVNVQRNGSFRHLLELEDGQRIQMIATNQDGQERLDLTVKVTSGN